jgi:hypothetical protein
MDIRLNKCLADVLERRVLNSNILCIIDTSEELKITGVMVQGWSS